MPVPPHPPHILVVDAQPDIFELLAPGFEERCYRVTHVEDVAAAKEVLGANPVEVVLVDIRLLNALGMMLVGQAAFGVPLLPLPANSAALREAVHARLPPSSEMPSTEPAPVDSLVKWIGDALRSRDLGQPESLGGGGATWRGAAP